MLIFDILIFGLLLVIVVYYLIMVNRWKLEIDADFDPSIIDSLKDYEVAFLLYGKSYVLKMAILALEDKGHLKIALTKDKFRMNLRRPIDGLHEIERSILNDLYEIGGTEYFFEDLVEEDKLNETLEHLFKSMREEFSSNGWILEKEESEKYEFIRFFSLILSLSLGIIFIPLVSYVWIGLVLCTMALLIVYFFRLPLHNRSLRAYIDKVRWNPANHFDNLKRMRVVALKGYLFGVTMKL